MTAATTSNSTLDARTLLTTAAGSGVAGGPSVLGSRAALARSSRFSATLKGLGAASSTVAGAWTPNRAGPALGGTVDVGATTVGQETLATAQASREQAQKPREANGKDSDDAPGTRGSTADGRSGGSTDTGPAGRSGASAALPDRPLSIRSLNDLLLTADPAVLELRNGAGLAKPAQAVEGQSSIDASAQPKPAPRPSSNPTNFAPNTSPPATAMPSIQADVAANHAGAACEQEPTPAGQPTGSDAHSTANSGASPAVVAGEKMPPASSSSGASPAGMAPPASAPVAVSEPATPSASGSTPESGIRAIDSGAGTPRTLQVRTAQAADPGEVPDPERFAALVSRGMAAAMAQKSDPQTGQREVTLRLQPNSLGELRVQVGMDGQTVTARFEAASAQARDLLDRSMAALRSSLEARGLHVDRLHVQLATAAATNANLQPGTDAGGEQVGRGSSQPGGDPAWNAGENTGAPDSGGWTATDGSGTQDRAGQDGERLAREVGGWLGSPRGVAGVGAAPIWRVGAGEGEGHGGAAAIGLAGANRPWNMGASVSTESLMIGIDTVA